jgi:hypothetical protein
VLGWARLQPGHIDAAGLRLYPLRSVTQPLQRVFIDLQALGIAPRCRSACAKMIWAILLSASLVLWEYFNSDAAFSDKI